MSISCSRPIQAAQEVEEHSRRMTLDARLRRNRRQLDPSAHALAQQQRGRSNKLDSSLTLRTAGQPSPRGARRRVNTTSTSTGRGRPAPAPAPVPAPVPSAPPPAPAAAGGRSETETEMETDGAETKARRCRRNRGALDGLQETRAAGGDGQSEPERELKIAKIPATSSVARRRGRRSRRRMRSLRRRRGSVRGRGRGSREEPSDCVPHAADATSERAIESLHAPPRRSSLAPLAAGPRRRLRRAAVARAAPPRMPANRGRDIRAAAAVHLATGCSAARRRARRRRAVPADAAAGAGGGGAEGGEGGAARGDPRIRVDSACCKGADRTRRACGTIADELTASDLGEHVGPSSEGGGRQLGEIKTAAMREIALVPLFQRTSSRPRPRPKLLGEFLMQAAYHPNWSITEFGARLKEEVDAHCSRGRAAAASTYLSSRRRRAPSSTPNSLTQAGLVPDPPPPSSRPELDGAAPFDGIQRFVLGHTTSGRAPSSARAAADGAAEVALAERAPIARIIRRSARRRRRAAALEPPKPLRAIPIRAAVGEDARRTAPPTGVPKCDFPWKDHFAAEDAARVVLERLKDFVRREAQPRAGGAARSPSAARRGAWRGRPIMRTIMTDRCTSRERAVAIEPPEAPARRSDRSARAIRRGETACSCRRTNCASAEQERQERRLRCAEPLLELD